MTVSSILKAKGNSVYTIGSGHMLSDAAKLLSERRIGAVVIVDGVGKVRGILSERDIVSAIATHGPEALLRPAGDYMTTNIFTCTRSDTVEKLMELMTSRRIRHVPVIDQGRLAGIVSIGDVVKLRIAETEFEAQSMRAYIVAG